MQQRPRDQRGGDHATQHVSSDGPARKHGIPLSLGSPEERVKKPTLTAENAETAEKNLGILGDLCVLRG